MYKHKLKIFFVLLLILGTQIFSELYLVKKDLYYIIPWLDIPMHIWGGFLFGLLFIYYVQYKNSDKLFSGVKFTHVLYFVILVGVLWEIYEYIHDIIKMKEWGGFLAASKDLVDDAIGAIIAYLFIARK